MSINTSIRKRRLIPAIIWALIIWTLSSIPSNDLPSVKILGFDKVAHIGIFGILSLLVNRCIPAKTILTTILVIYAILFLNASLDELHQNLIPGRSVSLWDLLANYTGLSIGLVALLFRK